MTDAKLYGHAVNLRTLEPHYSAHVAALARGELDPRDIAAEMAHRDAEIARLREALWNLAIATAREAFPMSDHLEQRIRAANEALAPVKEPTR